MGEDKTLAVAYAEWQATKPDRPWFSEAKLRDQWRDLLELYNKSKGQHSPGRDSRRILVFLLLVGPDSGAGVARRCGVGQANTTNATLPRLERYGLVDWRMPDDRDRQYGPPQGGGRPPRIWYLTRAGKEAAQLALNSGERLEL